MLFLCIILPLKLNRSLDLHIVILKSVDSLLDEGGVAPQNSPGGRLKALEKELKKTKKKHQKQQPIFVYLMMPSWQHRAFLSPCGAVLSVKRIFFIVIYIYGEKMWASTLYPDFSFSFVPIHF